MVKRSDAVSYYMYMQLNVQVFLFLFSPCFLSRRSLYGLGCRKRTLIFSVLYFLGRVNISVRGVSQVMDE